MSVFAPALSSLWQQIEDCGIDPQPLFRQNGVNASSPFDPNTRISNHKVDRIMAIAAKQSGDPFFGLRESEYFLPSHMGPLGFAWLASSSLRAALERLQRYIRVINETTKISLNDEMGALVVSVTTTELSENVYHRDGSNLAMLTSMCRFVSGSQWHPKRITFIHPEPADSAYYFSFFRCPVEFGEAENSLSIDACQADELLSGSNEQLAQLNDHIVIRYLASQARSDIVSQVKAAILENLGEGNVSESSVAESLHMSARSLNRKLKSESTSFRIVLLDIRTELANQYLNDATLTLTEISYMLGFSEISSFSRAYRRWTGLSPSDSRKAKVPV